jgi:1-deoxy-D-xylulose-5-phosphate reductoisomerase
MQEEILQNVDLLKVGSLEFKKIDINRYPIWKIKQDLLKNPILGVVINSANEASIEMFINKKIGFMDISKNIINAYEKFTNKPSSIDEVFSLDIEVRKYIQKLNR